MGEGGALLLLSLISPKRITVSWNVAEKMSCMAFVRHLARAETAPGNRLQSENLIKTKKKKKISAGERSVVEARGHHVLSQRAVWEEESKRQWQITEIRSACECDELINGAISDFLPPGRAQLKTGCKSKARALRSSRLRRSTPSPTSVAGATNTHWASGEKC